MHAAPRSLTQGRGALTLPGADLAQPRGQITRYAVRPTGLGEIGRRVAGIEVAPSLEWASGRGRRENNSFFELDFASALRPRSDGVDGENRLPGKDEPFVDAIEGAPTDHLKRPFGGLAGSKNPWVARRLRLQAPRDQFLDGFTTDAKLYQMKAQG